MAHGRLQLLPHTAASCLYSLALHLGVLGAWLGENYRTHLPPYSKPSQNVVEKQQFYWLAVLQVRNLAGLSWWVSCWSCLGSFMQLQLSGGLTRAAWSKTSSHFWQLTSLRPQFSIWSLQQASSGLFTSWSLHSNHSQGEGKPHEQVFSNLYLHHLY